MIERRLPESRILVRLPAAVPGMSWARGVIGAFESLLYPAVCPVCGDDLYDDLYYDLHGHLPNRSTSTTSRPRVLHDRCLALLQPRAQIVFEPRTLDEGVRIEALLQDGPHWFALLHRIKYAGEFRLLFACAAWLARAVGAGGGLVEPVSLVPVPDDPTRRRARGFSPVGMLACELGALLGVEVRSDLLRRARSVPSQTAMPDDRARVGNLHGVFRTGDLGSVSDERTLVLLEDQVTSGATVAECLLRLGARGHRMTVLALARSARTPSQMRLRSLTEPNEPVLPVDSPP